MTEKLARPRSLAEDVERLLQARIRQGQLSQGTKLPSEKRLAEEFGVSRSVVREALSRLKADGYVQSRQGAGVFVSQRPGAASFRMKRNDSGEGVATWEVYELRRVVEGAAAELAASRRSSTDIDLLQEALAEMDAAVAEGRDATDADDAFHRAIAGATGNRLLRRLVEFVGGQILESRQPTWSPRGRESGLATAAQVEHRQILAAILAGDPAAARTAAEAHIAAAARRIGVSSAGNA